MPATLSFSEALELLKVGKKVTRTGWNREGMSLAIQHPDEHSMNKQSYIYIEPGEGQRVPWVASQPDLLSSDWMEVTE